MRWNLEVWSVDYGDGERIPCTVPHAWRQDVPVYFEGPVTYQQDFDVPRTSAWLVFHGVSYHATVQIDGVEVADHRGIWDAFSIDLRPYKGKRIRLTVRVVKNGGETYPVRDVASGFLPFVYHTFGGIHGEVEVVMGESDPLIEAAAEVPEQRVQVEGHRIYVDGAPFYPRGLLHWGWYPELGHTNAPEDTIREEVRRARELGFNLVKFCLWVPPHRYLEIMKEEGMEAWMELPLWDPTDDPAHQREIASEIERIVRQYRRHDNIIIWTVGCELSTSTSPEYREYLYNLVKNLTGSPLVKDNSGGAEMYGGDLREFGDIYDFHPYCDTPFYPLVLDTLLPSARKKMPILLGEFNDIDVHRDLSRLHDELPYWASSMRELNEKGVRWQFELPDVVRESEFVHEPGETGHWKLMESSRKKALFIRKSVQEWVRAREAISGYVITGWRDTPISGAGFFDDWGQTRFSTEECATWNGEDVLYLIPNRRPPWVHGGNRPGFISSLTHFTGQVYWRIGVHSESGLEGGLVWSVTDKTGTVVAQGAAQREYVDPLSSEEVGQINWVANQAGEYTLHVEFGRARNSWPIWVVDKPDFSVANGWGLSDGGQVFDDVKLPGGDNLVASRPPQDLSQRLNDGHSTLLFLFDACTKPSPFWRESAYQFNNPEFWSQVPFAEEWERLLNVSGDRVIDTEWLSSVLPDGYQTEVLMNRIDVRTYVEAPVLVRCTGPGGTLMVTTLRPYGGLGIQPMGTMRNPAGAVLLQKLIETLSC